MMKKILLFVMSAVLLIGIVSCGDKNKIAEMTVEQIVERKAIIVGLYEGMEPFSFKNEEGSYSGFDLEVGKEIARRLGVTLNLRTISKEEAAASLADGTVDFLGNSLIFSEKELEKFEESDELFENRQIIVVLDTSEINKKSNLKDKKVGFVADVSKEADFDNDISKKAQMVEIETRSQALQSLKDGKIDALVIDEPWVYAYRAKGEALRIIGDDLDDSDYSLVFRRTDDELCEQIEKILEEMRRDGTLDKISQKVFGIEYKLLK